MAEPIASVEAEQVSAVPRAQPESIRDNHSLAHLAYESLSNYLVDGGLKAGDRLVEVQLAAALGVSRGPIRQALQQLAAEGWVEIRPRVGAFVAHRDRKAATDFFNVRHALEVLAAGEAAISRTEEDLHLLRECIAETKARAAASGIGPDSGVRARDFHRDTAIRFHELLAQATHNETLRDLLHVLVKKTRWYFTPGVLGHSDRAWREHQAIYDLVESHDAEGVRVLMDNHMDHTLASYLENIE